MVWSVIIRSNFYPINGNLLLISPKKILVASVAVAAPLLLMLLVAQVRFDGAEAGRRLVDWTRETQQRVLRLDGGAHLALFPRPALVLERGTLSGHRGAEAFAAFDEARLNLDWGFLLGGPPQVTGIVLRGLRADLAGAGTFDGTAKSGPLPFAVGTIGVERADLQFGAAGPVLHVERAQARLVDGALDVEGSGAGWGLSDLAVRLQSAPAGEARNLALGVTGLHGREKFDLRLAVGALRQGAQGFAAEEINLVAQLSRDNESFDVALRVPELAGGLESAQAGKATLSVNQIWKNGRLTLTYSGAASLGLTGAWLDWPAARLEVNLLEGGQKELFNTWQGATRFEVASARAE